MKNLFIRYFLIFFVVKLILFSCSTSEYKYKSSLVKVSIAPEVNHKPTDFYEIADSIFFIKLETTAQSILSKAIEVSIVFDQRIIVYDIFKNSVHLFCFEGKYLGEVGSKGRGPNEFENIGCVYVDPLDKTIKIFDQPRMTLFQYDINGQLLSSRRLGYYLRDICRIDHSHFLASVEDMNFSDGSIAICDKKYRIKERCFPPLPIEFETTTNAGFDYYNGEAYFLLPFRDIIYKATRDEIYPIIAVDFGSFKLDTEFSKKMSFLEFSRHQEKTDLAHSLRRISVNEHYYKLYYTYNGDPISVLIDKQNYHVNQFHKIEIEGAVIPAPAIFYRFADNWSFGIVGPIYFNYENNASFGKNGKYGVLNLFDEVVAASSITDNPILIFYKLKE